MGASLRATMENRRMRLVYLLRCLQWDARRHTPQTREEYYDNIKSVRRLEDLEFGVMASDNMHHLASMARATFATWNAMHGYRISFGHDGSWGEDSDDLPF